MDRKEYLSYILYSIRLDFSSIWKLWLEKRLAVYVCKNIISKAKNIEDETFYKNILDEIKSFNIFDDGRYVRETYESIWEREKINNRRK